uniref:Uncharacterized protein n=1 Tax=Trichogramma kaykai TaxID=54128 RepID=A0ABD2XIR9_9HYME
MAAMSDVHELSSILSSLIESVDWAIEEKRLDFFRKFSTSIWEREGGWNDLDLINLQDFFQDVDIPGSECTIEYLLFEALNCEQEGENFIEFVASTGYKDAPQYDENEEINECRQTPLHAVASSGRKNVVDALFKIYDDYSVNYAEPMDGYSHLHVACAYNRLDIAEQILELRQDPDITDRLTGEAPLHLAVFEGHREMAELLLRYGADPNWPCIDESTPLHLICREQDVKWARMLFKICRERGTPVEINAQDCLKFTPLRVALNWEKRDLVELLLQQGADPNLRDEEKQTPLHYICRKRDLEWATWFINICFEKNRPVAIDARDKDGCTPLIVALRRHELELAEFLLGKEANPNLSDNEGASALHTVCRYHDDDEAVAAAKTLFETRARFNKPLPLIDAQDERGNTPLHLAAMRDRPRLVTYLASLVRDTSATLANSNGRTFLHLIGRSRGNVIAAWQISDDHWKRRALPPKVVDARDAAQDTPLHLAARNRSSDAIELLLIHGADPNAANARGLTPLHEILLERSWDQDPDDKSERLAEKFIEVVRKVRKTVQVNAQDENGDAPLHLALRRGKKKAAELLLSQGANPNLANAMGDTAMLLVCNPPTPNEDEALELAKTVFESSQECFKPLQLEAQNRNGWTALHYLLSHGQKRLVRLLLERGIDLNLTDECGNALHQAVFHDCDVDMVKMMFECYQATNRQLDINARNIGGWTPVLLAVHMNRDELFEFLLRSGADPNIANAEGETCVHLACELDHEPRLCSRARALFAICAKRKQPVRIDAEDNEGRTPLERAVASHSATMVDLILDQGPDLSSFLFPTESYLKASWLEVFLPQTRFIMASGTLAVLDRLTERGYELDRSDVLAIETFFSSWVFVHDSANFEGKLYEDKEFETQAKEMKIDGYTSLYDLIQKPVDSARLLYTPMQFYEFAHELDWLKLPRRLWNVCAWHLCERLPRKFFEQSSG